VFWEVRGIRTGGAGRGPPVVVRWEGTLKACGKKANARQGKGHDGKEITVLHNKPRIGRPLRSGGKTSDKIELITEMRARLKGEGHVENSTKNKSGKKSGEKRHHALYIS